MSGVNLGMAKNSTASLVPEICTDVTLLPEARARFTICTLVTNPEQYSAMVESFTAQGFDPVNARYLYVDNTKSNAFDAYAGLNRMIAQSETPFIILCHQDLTLITAGFETLVARLAELEVLDPDWAVAGNAGATGKGRYAMHITSRDGRVTKLGVLPAKVESLDENFIILKRAACLGFSKDLNGFHLYGTDIVIQARLRGYASYVIDFHLHHHGEGRMDQSFFECQMALETKYSRLFRSRYFQGVCRRILLTPSRFRLAVQHFKSRRKLRRASQGKIPVGL